MATYVLRSLKMRESAADRSAADSGVTVQVKRAAWLHIAKTHTIHLAEATAVAETFVDLK